MWEREYTQKAELCKRSMVQARKNEETWLGCHQERTWKVLVGETWLGIYRERIAGVLDREKRLESQQEQTVPINRRPHALMQPCSAPNAF
ncbi:hypothetical protein NPIL_257391 [Nephila pilipes]|uniref:Uncharacterized protein n=1 Tax=Nephila pilipes TaxID=299642 RepID=A0A8X6U6X8_NEPPI|nr:hypothetical protein NPIL_257391 [Nephila pilipes]